MKQLILVFSIVFSFQVFSQTTCDLQNHYGDFIKITKKSYKDIEYLNHNVVRVDSQYCFADYVNNNLRHIEYLLFCFYSNSHNDSLKKIDDSLTLQSVFTADIQSDSLFNSVMSELTAKVINKNVPKDTITMNALMNIAVKFFYMNKISEEGYYSFKICTAINGIKETEQERKPFIEAFSFVSITKYYMSNREYDIYNDIRDVVKELYKVNMGVDEKERLLRARGAVFMQMFYNKKLRELFLYEYEQKKEYLPFVLTDI